MGGAGDSNGHRSGVAETIHLEEINTHVEKHLGKIATVLHEIVSDIIHLDVLVVDPGPAENYWIFVTSGMSDLPMAVPQDIEEADEHKYAELTISLPKTWLRHDLWRRDEQEQFSEAEWYPLRLLKSTARFPHEARTWLGPGHSVVNDKTGKPIGPGTEMNGVVLSRPVLWPEEAMRLVTATGDTINFFAIYPVYPSEMRFKLEHGAARLYDRFGNAGVTDIFNPKRKNVCPPSIWSRLRGNK